MNKSSQWDLSSNESYKIWREKKLRQAQELHNAPIIEIKDIANISESEKKAILDNCKKTNMAIYQSAKTTSPNETRIALRNFAQSFNLEIAEKHRSAGESGIVAITPSNAKGQKGYMPYSNRPMNWHTDGYYNAANEQIRAMVLHCVIPSTDGGSSQFFDNEIAYIRLRDHNPDFIKALMHNEAMSIPQNIEENGDIRPISIGPVFSFDENSENLIMRYTARTKSIIWRDDEITKQAVAFLQNLLETGDEFMQSLTLKAGQGVLCNNSLHNRTGFNDKSEDENKRMLFRVRFHNRIKGS